MTSHCDSEESRPHASVVLDIIDGKAWKARPIRNNHLRQHCHQLSRIFQKTNTITASLRPVCRRLLTAIARNTPLLIDHHPSEYPLMPVLMRISAYHANWIRDPESWLPCAQKTPRQWLRSLLEHLFADWPMPSWADSAWLEKGDLIYLERDWYCLLAMGKSLRKTQGMPPSMTSKALHLAMQAPDTCSLRQALRWGQVKAADGSDELAREVLCSRMVWDLSNDAIWSRLIEKFARNPGFTSSRFTMISDTLLGMISKNGCQHAMSIIQKPLSELWNHSIRFWHSVVDSLDHDYDDFRKRDIHCPNLRAALSRQVLASWPNFSDGQPFECVCPITGRLIRIHELNHHAQLITESRTMHHCVISYRRSCQAGVAAIFSMREVRSADEHRLLTIEVHPETRRIIQVREKWNWWQNSKTHPVLKIWAEKLRLNHRN